MHYYWNELQPLFMHMSSYFLVLGYKKLNTFRMGFMIGYNLSFHLIAIHFFHKFHVIYSVYCFLDEISCNNSYYLQILFFMQ